MSTKNSAPFTLTSPCSNCPFRSDVAFYLRTERVAEIARSLRQDHDFYCHKTVDHAEDEDGESTSEIGPRGRVCAGALITMKKEGASTQGVQVAERLGMYDTTRMDMDAPVYPSLEEWVRNSRSHPGDTGTQASRAKPDEDLEHCEVTGPECMDPAGYAYGSQIKENEDEGTCGDKDVCEDCGSRVCEGCASPSPGGCAPWGQLLQ